MSAAPWLSTAGVVQRSNTAEPSHSRSYDAHFGGHGKPTIDVLLHSVAIPSGCANDTLSFYRNVDTTEGGSAAVDTLTVQVLNSSGTVLATLTTLSNTSRAAGYQQPMFNLSAFAGQMVRIRFRGSETDSAGGTTNFVIDDTALNVS